MKVFVTRFLSLLALSGLGLAILWAQSVQADEKDRLVGTWRFVSFVAEGVDTKEARKTLGEHPQGYLVILADGTALGLSHAEGRKAPTTPEDCMFAFNTGFATFSTYVVRGDKIIFKPEVALNPALVGVETGYTFQIQGNKLTFVTDPPVYGPVLKQMVRQTSTYERVK